MTLRLTLARHAEPGWYVDDRFSTDPDLTPRGREQAQRLADRLAAETDAGIWRADAIVASPLRRVQQTVAPIAERLALPVTTLPWLAEIPVPGETGQSRDELFAIFRGLRGRRPADWHQGPGGGESFDDFAARIDAGLRGWLTGALGLHERTVDGHRLWDFPPGEPEAEVLAGEPPVPPVAATPSSRSGPASSAPAGPRRPLIVAHCGTISVIVATLLGAPLVPWEWDRLHLRLTGLATVHTLPLHDGHVFALDRFNDVAHIAGTERSADAFD
jgi:broad specificity phosphatase PhoE